MSAQTNDPLSAFAYPPVTATANSFSSTTPPSSPSSQVVTPVDPNMDVTPAVPSNVEPDATNAVSTPLPDESLAEEKQTDTLTTLKSNQAEVVENVVTPTNQSSEESKDEEKESPLQALARKLSKLREELVQEVPENNPEFDNNLNKTDAPTPVSSENMEVQDPSLSLGKDVNASPSTAPISVTDNLNIPKEEVSDQASSQEVLPSQDFNSLGVFSKPTPDTVSTLNTPDDTTNSDQSETVVEAPSVSVQPNEEVNNLQPSVEIDPLTALKEGENSKVEPVSSPMPTEVGLDENDNSVVSPDQVEVASVDSKYPLNINKILDMAIERNASDIQVSVGYPVMLRIDGTLIEANPQIVSTTNAEELIMPVLSEQKKELLEVNREVDLAYSPLQNKEARFRINAYYSKGNLTAAFRLIPSKIRTIEELMLPPIYNQLIKLSQGLVLVTGPTGHGKSTTLAAMLQSINNSRAVHMITIEDPIEYMFKPSMAVIDQREMHDDTHSWTVALKSALRQDPDVILVGEMRDYETIAATITLAETGHLVFATLHTNSAAQTVDRIIDVFPENQQAQIRTQLSNIIEAVVAQRLLPIDGGGRRAVSELMLGTPAVRNLIREGKTHQLDNVIRTSADVGMFSLEQSLVKLVREGLITMERAQEYAVHPEEVVRLLKT